VFLQVNHLGKAGSARLVERTREWMPEMGLGVWPDRDPPTLWTHADFADLGPGERIRPLMYQVMPIAGAGPNKRMALGVMLGVGAALEIVMPDDGEAFFEQSKALLVPPIKERALLSFSIYIPLFERKSCESAAPEQLDSWFCGASAYMRESVEDNGVLIVSKNR
jgi:hypothetical protein